MKYLLDTNACIAILTGRPTAGVETRFLQASPDEVALCSIVKSELLFGARNSSRVAENLSRLEEFFEPLVSLAFDDEAAGQAGAVRAALSRSGTPIGPNDLMIGSIALVHGLTVVTHDTGEFRRIPGLRVEDWEASS